MAGNKSAETAVSLRTLLAERRTRAPLPPLWFAVNGDAQFECIWLSSPASSTLRALSYPGPSLLSQISLLYLHFQALTGAATVLKSITSARYFRTTVMVASDSRPMSRLTSVLFADIHKSSSTSS